MITVREPDEAHAKGDAIDVSIIMPCLNERNSLPHCILNARPAFDVNGAALGIEACPGALRRAS